MTSPQVVYLKGKRFLFVGGMFASNFINMFRYDGEIAVPSGVIMQWGNRLYRTDLTWLPNRPEGRTFIWRDTSGDGAYQADEYAPNTARVRPGPFWVDQRGDIWMAYGTFRYEFQGLDPTGNPIYRADKTTAWDPPEGMKDLARVWCDADRDMRVAAEQGVDKRGRADMRHIGRVFVCKGYKAGNRRAVSFRSGADREAGCVARVTSDQKATGGWGIEDPDWDVHACFDAVFVLRQLGGDDPKVSAAIGRGADWALHCRNTDGGFGHFPGRHSDMDAGYFQFGTLIQAGRVPGVRDLPDAHTLSWGHAMQPVRVYENRPLNPG